jgi:phosphoglycerate dehydrogenase-like enzyme
LSDKRKVLIMDKISERMESLCRGYLGEQSELVFCKDDSDREKHISSANVLVTFTEGVSREWLEKAESCVLIQKLGAGVNNIDIEGATNRNIQVSNTVGLNATSVAEHSVLLMAATLKHLVTAHNKIVQEGIWLKTGLRDRSYELSYKKVGLVGFGNIGRQVKRILSGYGCEVFYYDIYRLPPEEEKALGVKYMEIDQLIEEADIVSLHVPLNKHTYHLLNEDRLRRMKKTAVLINTCRGGVVDEKALYEVLSSGHLTGAGLDVFESEPITNEHLLASLPNVILTPHIGGGTKEAMEAVIQKACENINSVLHDGIVTNEDSVVNRKELNKSLN